MMAHIKYKTQKEKDLHFLHSALNAMNHISLPFAKSMTNFLCDEYDKLNKEVDRERSAGKDLPKGFKKLTLIKE